MKTCCFVLLCRLSVLAIIVGFGVLVPSRVFAAPLVFSDSFEGPGLDSFWTMETSNGVITAPSPAAAHSGTNSAQFDSTSFPNQVFLRHDFATPVYGTASVWVFDTGADHGLSNYLVFQLHNFTASKNTYIQANDHNGGPDGSIYVYDTWNSDTAFNSSASRTHDWHLWEITSRPTAYEIKIDGTVAFSDSSGLAIESLRFGMYDGYDLSQFGYFDDFRFEEFDVNAVPEPASLALLGSAFGMGSITLFRRRKSAQC